MEHSEAKVLGFFPIFDVASQAKINVTFREGATPEMFESMLTTIRDSMAVMGQHGFSLTVGATGTALTRTSDFWVRGKSKNGIDVLWGYADHPKMTEKNVNVWPQFIEQLPITQEQWDAAPVWDNGGSAPTKDAAVSMNYIQDFPHPITFGMEDTGQTFNGHAVHKVAEVIGAAAGGVKFADTRSSSTPGTPRPPAPVGTPQTANVTGHQCPECNAPAGRPHASKCSMATGQPPTPAVAGNGGPKRGFPQPPAPRAHISERQKLTAQVMLMGKSMYAEQWDEVREGIVCGEPFNVQSGSLGDLSDQQISAVSESLKDSAIEATLSFAATAGWDANTAQDHLVNAGYSGAETWDQDLASLPIQFIVKLFELSMMGAVEPAK